MGEEYKNKFLHKSKLPIAKNKAWNPVSGKSTKNKITPSAILNVNVIVFNNSITFIFKSYTKIGVCF